MGNRTEKPTIIGRNSLIHDLPGPRFQTRHNSCIQKLTVKADFTQTLLYHSSAADI